MVEESVTCDWSMYPNFTKEEFDCSATGENDMQPTFMAKLQSLRRAYGKPMTITSGYRDKTHPKEAKKAEPGQHSKGLAADIACGADDAFKIASLAFRHGFTGVGISQRIGQPRFIHLDLRAGTPVLYSY